MKQAEFIPFFVSLISLIALDSMEYARVNKQTNYNLLHIEKSQLINYEASPSFRGTEQGETSSRSTQT